MRLLLAGDIHIGRTSSRVGAIEHRQGFRSDLLQAAAAWHRMVDLAIEQAVDLVLLSGDIADEDNRFWEAIGPLERGVERLAERGIATVAVAGNHDHDVLGRLANHLDARKFRLLGRGGRWERHTIERDGRAVLHLDGWSFPQSHFNINPLTRYDLPRDATVPTLGLVHGDLDVSSSSYAPLSLSDLLQRGLSAWLLGHIHAERLAGGEADGTPWVLYPGSPQALDPGETGRHGVWITELRHGGFTRPTHHQISTVWYERCAIDLTPATIGDEVDALVLEGTRQHAERIAANAAGSPLAVISLRLRLVGRTSIGGEVAKNVARMVDATALEVSRSVTAEVNAVEVDTLPAIDLASCARSATPPGALARLLLTLGDNEEGEAAVSAEGSAESAAAAEGLRLNEAELKSLMAETRQALQGIGSRPAFAGLKTEPDDPFREVDDATVRTYLRRQARALLTELTMQSDNAAPTH